MFWGRSPKKPGRVLLMSFWQKLNRIIRRIPLWQVGVGVGILFLAIGFFEEQFAEIYRKAVMICLECIGIG